MNALREPGAKALFQIESSPTLRLIACVILSVVLMVVDHRQGHLDAVRSALAVLIYPVQALVDLPFDVYRSASTGLASRSALLEENQRRRTQQLEDAVRLQRLEALETENQRLRELLQRSPRLGDHVQIAEIFQVDLDPFRHRVLLDRGSRAGVYTGQAVVDAAGIMGQITTVNPFSAEAILITDADHAVPVEVNRNGLRTIALGTGNIIRLELPFLPNNADIEEGDLLVSSGLGGTFPRGYPVAQVSAVERDPGQPFARVLAVPTAALNRSREVLLVWTPEALDPPPEDGGDADGT